MALQYKLDAEAFGSLEEGQQGLYKQEGNVYILDVDGISPGGDDDIARLKEQNEKLLSEKKAAQRAAKEAEDAAAKEAADKAKAEGDYKQLFESQQAETEKWKQQFADLETKVQTQAVKGEAQRIAATLTKDTARAELLTEKIQQRLKPTDEGIKVTDEAGNLTVSTVDELTANIKTTFPFLVDGSQASGGAAPGSKGGAGDQKQISRSEFDGLDHVKRAEFVKSGGAIVDD